jgi:hypothetical protein
MKKQPKGCFFNDVRSGAERMISLRDDIAQRYIIPFFGVRILPFSRRFIFSNPHHHFTSVFLNGIMEQEICGDTEIGSSPGMG